MRVRSLAPVTLAAAVGLGCGGKVVVEAETGAETSTSAASSGSGGAAPEPWGDTGQILDWPESTSIVSLDDLSSIATNIDFSWSVADVASSGYFYIESDSSEIAPAGGPIGAITDASSLPFGSSAYYVGPLEVGGIAVLRRTDVPRYAAVRFDAFYATNGSFPYANADVSWFVPPPGSADFSGFE